jgi:hypothetical protein
MAPNKIQRQSGQRLAPLTQPLTQPLTLPLARTRMGLLSA